MPDRSRGHRGQTTVEFVLSFGLLSFLLVAVIQVSLICSTKLIANYSSWIAARVWAVNPDDPNRRARGAAMDVLRALDWGVGPANVSVDIQAGNEGVEVRYRTPLGIAYMLKNDRGHRVTALGWGTVPLNPLRDVAEQGDNRER
ncbi:MAG: hypothetical protein ACRD1X_07815 [Vicinamibacteria bacterium]